MFKQTWTSRRSLAVVASFAIALSFACSGTGGGCAALQPIPSGRYEGPKTDNAINLRVSPDGVNYLNKEWRALLGTFMPGTVIDVPVGCQRMDPTGIRPLVVADQGRAGCGSESCGQLDGKCCPTATTAGCNAGIVDAPVNVPINITGFQLVPRAPDKVEGTISLTISTGAIMVATDGNSGYCLGLDQIKCAIDFKTNRASPASNTVAATVKFAIDTKWDKLLAFSVTALDGTKVCGSSGASPKPRCLDPDDLDFYGKNTCGDTYCGVLGWDPIKEFILKQISPFLQSSITDMVDAQSCQQCGTGLPACPQLATATSTCQDGVCVDSATSKCVPRFLGMEGRVAPGLLLSGFGIPADAELDLSVAAGSSVSVDQGINLGTRAGLVATKVADCVPALAPPQLGPVTVPDFDADVSKAIADGLWPLMANPGNPAELLPRPYHVGIGVSKQFLDLAMHHAHQSGSLCLGMTAATTGMLNTGLFRTFLPSLGKLATRDGLDAPMMIVLKPGQVPQITVGEGTFDAITKKPIKPLLRLDLPALTIDFYAMLDDRYVRLFSLTADVSVPLSMIFEGCSSVSPALGDLKQLITNIQTANSEILAEDPKVLADLIPAVIGFAEPALAGALKPFALPALGAFKVKVNATRGVTQITGTETYEHLGLYGELMAATAQCATAAPTTVAHLVRSWIPEAEAMRLEGKPLPWPAAVLQLSAQGGSGEAEFAWRVDGGLWSTFLAPDDQGLLEVSHPAFLLQGRHTIEVRSRYAEQPHGVSDPVRVPFVVDWEPPQVTLTADAERGVLQVLARDAVTPPDALVFSYQVGQQPPSEFGPARTVDLAAIEAQGGLTVRVRDGAGNVGQAIWRVPTLAEQPRPAFAADEAAAQGAGCAASGGAAGLWSLWAFAGAVWRRRARSR